MNLLIIHPNNIGSWWPEVGPWISMAVGGADFWTDVEQVRASLEQGFAHLWVERNDEGVCAVLVTEPMLIGGKRFLILRWCAGEDSPNWLDHIAYVENFAKAKGFYGVQVWGRKGWERKLKPFGFFHDHTVLSKIIERGLH